MGTVFNTPDDGCCDTRNMYSSFAVNKYVHTVASVGFLFTLNYDARNHELKKGKNIITFSGSLGILTWIGCTMHLQLYVHVAQLTVYASSTSHSVKLKTDFLYETSCCTL